MSYYKNYKYTLMSRLFTGIFLIIILFSCSQRLNIREYKAINMPILAETSKADSAISQLIKPFSDSIETQMSKVIAISSSELVAGKPESSLTNLISDILFEFGTSFCSAENNGVKPDFAYVNYGGLRSSLPKGNIVVRKIFELMPFENEIVMIKITGESVLKMANKIASRGGEGISGMKIGIKNREANSVLINGMKLDLEASYWIVTNDYVADGGDQMDMFLKPIERFSTKQKVRDVIINSLSEYYKANGVIDVKLDGRIYNEQ